MTGESVPVQASDVDLAKLEGALWRLRRPTPDDEMAIAEFGRQGDARWLGIGPYSPPEQRAAEIMAEFRKGVAGTFGEAYLIVTRKTNAIIGEIGVHDRGGCFEIVYGIAPAWRGRGLATEVLTSATRHMLEEDASRRLELVIAQHNAASIRVAEKSGYRCIGVRTTLVEATSETYEDLVFVPSAP